MDNLKPYYFDFLSTDPKRAGGYVLIYAESESAARKAMFEKHGKQWNFCYSKEDFFDGRFPPSMYCYDTISPVFNQVTK